MPIFFSIIAQYVNNYIPLWPAYCPEETLLLSFNLSLRSLSIQKAPRASYETELLCCILHAVSYNWTAGLGSSYSPEGLAMTAACCCLQALSANHCAQRASSNAVASSPEVAYLLSAWCLDPSTVPHHRSSDSLHRIRFYSSSQKILRADLTPQRGVVCACALTSGSRPHAHVICSNQQNVGTHGRKTGMLLHASLPVTHTQHLPRIRPPHDRVYDS